MFSREQLEADCLDRYGFIPSRVQRLVAGLEQTAVLEAAWRYERGRGWHLARVARHEPGEVLRIQPA